MSCEPRTTSTNRPKISDSAIRSHWFGSARRPRDVKATNFDAMR